MTHRRILLVLSMVCSTLLMLEPSVAQAETSDDDYAMVDESSGPIVRRQLLYRSSRLEIQPLIAQTLNDSFISNTLAGANITYHLNNSFAVGVTGTYGLLQSDTGLRENVFNTLKDNNPARLDDLSYSYVAWAADLGISYVPIFGKFTILNGLITHYDFHVMGGLSVVGEDAVKANEKSLKDVDSALVGVRPGGMIGAGFRFFVGDMISINVEARDYIYSRAQVSSGSVNPKIGNNVIMSLGVGIFLPGDVKISR